MTPPLRPFSSRHGDRRQLLRWLTGMTCGLAGTAANATSAASGWEGSCVAPSKPGGGFDLTCALVGDALQSQAGAPALRTRYLPGGIGAVAYHQAATGALRDEPMVIAFSGGSLLNIAQGRFGPHTHDSVRWLCTLGFDYGVIAVRPDSPFKKLADLVNALRAGADRVAFGAGGTIGSQDWCKAALLVRAAAQDHRPMRFVSFEGGGDAMKALLGGHVDVFTGDAAEAWKLGRQGTPLRVLAALSPQRLAGDMALWPTAREQGIDLTWPTVRGLYMPPQVPDQVFARWEQALHQALHAPAFAALCLRHGLEAAPLTGPALRRYIQTEMQRYAQLMQTLGLRRW